MYPQEYETLTYDLCNKFREYLRFLIVDMQDICYSYRDEKNRDLSFWKSATKEIDSTIRSFLYIEKFEDYRYPIESFQTKFDHFADSIKSNQNVFLNEITTQLKQIENSQELKSLIGNASFEDDKKWSEIERQLRKMKTKKDISPDLYKNSSNSSIRGKAISHIFSVIKELKDFYATLPKVMTLEDKKIYVLQRENDKLTKQNRVKDTQINQLQRDKKNMQTKLDSEIKAHKDDLVKADVRYTSQFNKIMEKNDQLEEEIKKYKDRIKELEEIIRSRDETIQKKDKTKERDDVVFQEILSMCSWAKGAV